MTKKTFLVVYEYGQGGVWAFVRASSQDEIRRRFPELTVVTQRPGWMSRAEADRIKRTSTYDVDRPAGLLRDVIASRKGPSAGTG